MLSESLEAVIAQKLLINKTEDGRVPACEILIANPAVKNLIREDKIYQIPSLIQSSGHEGMQTLDQDLQRLVSQGLVTREHALEIADEPEKFEKGIY